MIFQQYIPQNEAAEIYNLKCDYIIKNELEGPLIEGIHQFQKFGYIKDVKGYLIKQENGKFKDTGYAKMFSAEEIWSFPDFEKARFKDYIILKRKYSNGPVSFNLNTSKGCAFKCAFCGQANSGTKLRSQSPTFVVDQIEYLQKNYDLRDFIFIDNIFSGFKPRAKEICREIIKRKLSVSFIVNDRVRYYDNELINLLKNAGCTTIKVGVETADKKTQLYIDKEVDNKKELEKMKEIKSSGLKLSFYMTPGIPGEDLKTLWLNAKFIVDSNVDSYSVGPLWVMPGSPLYYRLKLENKIIINEWSQYRNLKSISFKNDTYKSMNQIKRAIFFMYLFTIVIRFFKTFRLRKKELYKAFPRLKYSFLKKIFIRLPIIEK
jgi:anaerobic magnesium-protoporphyrin IX monomethyl ester cyclase